MSKVYRSSTISSPCVMVCRLNSAGECVGCGRTQEEITRWLSYTEAERRAIMDRLQAEKGAKR